jgi:tetratricopeptide (TPR) repeat protein
VTLYDRADVLRILRVSNRQLLSWEKAGLLSASEKFSFADLIQIKALRDMAAHRVRSNVIARSVQQMRLASGMKNPLVEAKVEHSGKRLAFRHEGHVVEPKNGQLVLDFAFATAATARKVVSIKEPELRAQREAQPKTVAEIFARGVALEEDPLTQQQAVETYLRVLEIEPQHAAAHINLGTIYYNRQDYAKAEQFYRQAIAADPQYALGYFDLGNVLDETGRLPEAVRAYRMAIMLAPSYADAHYNLALAYEKLRLQRRALIHWRRYIKLDTVGPWSNHAKAQIQKIMRDEKLKIVVRN